MILSGFDESNHVLSRPPEMTAEECDPAQVFVGIDTGGRPIVITCWKPTREELDEIERTGRVWLILYGRTMQPAIVTGFKPF